MHLNGDNGNENFHFWIWSVLRLEILLFKVTCQCIFGFMAKISVCGDAANDIPPEMKIFTDLLP